MPQIGWFEIVVVVVLAILVVGPKDFPIMLKKIGTWVSSFKNYFADVKKDMTDMENNIEDEILSEKYPSNINDNKKKDE